MKSIIYHGAKLREAIRLLTGEYPHKYTYWTDLREEALPYAQTNKRFDRSLKGGIVEGTLDVPSSLLYNLSRDERNIHYTNKRVLKSDKINRYDLGSFSVFVTPMSLLDRISHKKIETIV